MNRISVVCIVIFIFYNEGVTLAAKWNYKDLSHWPKQCSVGKHQSPIDLSSNSAEGKTFPPFIFKAYDQSYTWTIQNNGHTVQIRFDPSAETKPTVSGGGLIGEYILDSMHFHWESEHTIDQRRFPSELHMVHYGDDAKTLENALSIGRVAVLGVLFYNSPDDDSKFAPIFEAIQQIQQQKETPNEPQSLSKIDLDDFLPRDRAGFYRYNGSLTTPECTEGVLWTVFTNGLPISQKQLDIFSKLLTNEKEPMEKNYRPLQDINDRTVYLKVSEMGGSDGNLITVGNSVKIFMLVAIVITLV